MRILAALRLVLGLRKLVALYKAASGASILRHLRFSRKLVAGLASVFIGLPLLLAGAFYAYLATLDQGAMQRALVALLQERPGNTFTYARSEIHLWPRPKFVFQQVLLVRPGLEIASESLDIRASWRDLLDGQIDRPSIVLDQARVKLTLPQNWAQQANSPRALLEGLLASGAWLETALPFSRYRLRLFRTRLEGWAPLASEVMSDVHFSQAHRFSGEIHGGTAVNSVEVDLTTDGHARLVMVLPASHAAEGAVQLLLDTPAGAGRFTGTFERNPDPRLRGEVAIRLHQRAEVLLGKPVLVSSRGAYRLDGQVEANLRGINLERMSFASAQARLDGLGALRANSGRWNLSATLDGSLAGEGALIALLAGLWFPDGLEGAVRINPLPGLELDLRVSATQFPVLNLPLQAAALSVLTRMDRAEIALIDARLNNANVRARLALQRGGALGAGAFGGQQNVPGGDLAGANQAGANKVQANLYASAEALDLAFFSRQAANARPFSGSLDFAVESRLSGESGREWLASARGEGSFTLRKGVFDIPMDGQLAEAGPLLLRAMLGQEAIPVERMQGSFTLEQGKLVPHARGTFTPALSTFLDGEIDLPARRMGLQLAITQNNRLNFPRDLDLHLYGPLTAPRLRVQPVVR